MISRTIAFFRPEELIYHLAQQRTFLVAFHNSFKSDQKFYFWNTTFFVFLIYCSCNFSMKNYCFEFDPEKLKDDQSVLYRLVSNFFPNWSNQQSDHKFYKLIINIAMEDSIQAYAYVHVRFVGPGKSEYGSL